MSLARLLADAAKGGGPKKAAPPKATFAALRKALRDEATSDDEAEAAFMAYVDRLTGAESGAEE